MKLIRLVPVVAAACLLAACSPTPSTVAVVNGERITSEDLQRTIDGCAELGITTDTLPVKAHVLYLTAGALVRQTAEAHGFALHDGEVYALAQGTNFAQLLGNEECAQLSIPAVGLGMLSEAYGQDELIAEMQGADIEVNPRFGYWDSESLGVVGSGSLSLAPDSLG